jgi:gliding motility-associated-like protein
MKTITSVLSKISASVVIFLSLSSAFAQPNNCLKIGQNIGAPSRANGELYMFKDLMKGCDPFVASVGASGNVFYAVPADVNGYPTKVPTDPLGFIYAPSGFQNVPSIPVISTQTLTRGPRDFSFGPGPEGVYYVFWEGEGQLNLQWNRAGAIITTAGTYGTITTSGTSYYLGTTVDGLGISSINVNVVSSTGAGLHYCQLRVPNILNGDSDGGIYVNINQSNPNNNGNHIRSISIIYPNRLQNGSPIVSGQPINAFANPQNVEFYLNKPFNPMWMEWLKPFAQIRAMVSMGANGINDQFDRTWTTRRPKDYYTQNVSHDGKVGISMAYEWIIEIANVLNKNIAINVSAAADQNHMEQMAQLFYQQLNPGLEVHVEVGNEATWNFAPGFNSFFVLNSFSAANGLSGPSEALVVKEGWAWKAFENAFGVDSNRVKRIMAGQAVNPDILAQRSRLHFDRRQNWDYFSIAWYLGIADGPDITAGLNANSTPNDIIREMKAKTARPKTDNDSYANVLFKHIPITRNYGKKLSLYEGGSHMTFSQNGRENWDGVILAKFHNPTSPTVDPTYGPLTVRHWYRQMIDTLRNYPEIIEANHFIAFGALYDDAAAPPTTKTFGTAPNFITSHGFASVPSIFSDTTSMYGVGNPTQTVATTFGPYTINANNKHAVWKELVLQAGVAKSCVVTVTTNTIAGGNALTFKDFNNQYVNINGASPLTDAGNFTIETWIKPEDGNKVMDLVAFSNATGGNNSLNTIRLTGNNRISWVVNNTAGGNIINIVASNSFKVGSWYHVAAVKSGSTYNLYINGVLAGNSSGSGTFNSNRLNFGTSRVSTGLPSNYFRGQLDEVRIWNSALTPLSIRNWMCKKLTNLHPDYATISNYYNFNTVAGLGLIDGVGVSTSTLNNYSTTLGIDFYVISGAPIGDQSINIYPSSWTSASLSYTNPIGGDIFQVGNLGSGSPDGVHVYVVNEPPFLRALPSYYTSLSTSRWYGVFVANGDNPQYDVTYYFQGNPGASNTLGWNRLVKRDDNADASWINAGARLDNVTRSLTVSCRETNRGEYILGVRQNLLPNRAGPGSALYFSGTYTAGQANSYAEIQFNRANNYTVSYWAKGGGCALQFSNDVPSQSTSIRNDGINGGIGLGARWDGYTVNNGQYSFRYAVADNNINPNIVGNNTDWNFYTVTRSGNLITFYINGVVEGSIVVESDQDLNMTKLRLGGVNNCCSCDAFSGAIDELTLWNKPFSLTEIRDLMCKKVTEAHPNYCNLTGYFRFDENSGNVLENMVGSGDLILTNALWTTSGAALGDASAYNYNNPYGASISHPNGDVLQYRMIKQEPNGVFGTQLYRVDAAPNFKSSTVSGYSIPATVLSFDSSRYWGVYPVTRGANDNGTRTAYYLTYNYASNQRINLAQEASLVPLDRNSNQNQNWSITTGRLLDTNADNILIIPNGRSITGINTTTERITIPNHGFNSCDFVTYYGTGAPIGGLGTSGNEQWRVYVVDANTISLHTRWNATECAAGTNPQDISGSISSDNWIVSYPAFNRDELMVAGTNIATFNFSTAIPTVAGVTGKTTVCQGETGLVYRITAPVDSRATSFIWSGSAGLAVNASNRDTVLVNVIAAAAGTETLTVRGVNVYGLSTPPTVITINVQATGYLSSNILGALSVCQGNLNIPYTISAAAPSFTWSVSGASFNGANTGTAIGLNFPTTTTKATLSVFGNYACGQALINSLVIDNNKAPATNLIVYGDSICDSGLENTIKISVESSELDVTYYVYDGATPITSINGTGGLVRMQIPKTYFPVDFTTARALTVRAQNGSCPASPVTVGGGNVYAMRSSTLTGAQLASIGFIPPPAICANVGSGAANIGEFNITLTGTTRGVSYVPAYFDNDRNGGAQPFTYVMGAEVEASGTPTVLQVTPSVFPYWFSYVTPSTIGGLAMTPGCPSQRLTNVATITLTRSAPVALPSKITGPGQGVRMPGDNDWDICGTTSTYYTTANGGATSAFFGNETTMLVINGQNTVTFTGGFAANLAVNDVIYSILDISDNTKWGFGFPVGGNNVTGPLYIRTAPVNIGGGRYTATLSDTRGGTTRAPNNTFTVAGTAIRIWCPITVPLISSGTNTFNIPAKYGNTGLRLYSQIQFYNANGTYPNPVNNSADYTYYVASISGFDAVNGTNVMLSILDGGQSGVGGSKSHPYTVHRQMIQWTNGNNFVTGEARSTFQDDWNDGRIQNGDILRDMNDNVIGIVSGYPPSQTQINLVSNITLATSGLVNFSYLSPLSYTSNAFSVVFTAPTTANSTNGYTWTVYPPEAVSNMSGFGGTYIPSQGKYVNGDTDASGNKAGVTITWAGTYSGIINLSAVAANSCGASQERVNEAGTPGYERTYVSIEIKSRIPTLPEPISFTDIPFCQNPTTGMAFSTITQNATGGYQWVMLGGGAGTNLSPYNDCFWENYEGATTLPGVAPIMDAAAGVGCTPISTGQESNAARTATAIVKSWQPGLVGVLTVTVRAIGCDLVTTSPWVRANVTVGSAFNLVPPAISGPSSRCIGAGTSTYAAVGGNADSYVWYAFPANQPDIYSGMLVYYPFDNGLQNRAVGPLSKGANADGASPYGSAPTFTANKNALANASSNFGGNTGWKVPITGTTELNTSFTFASWIRNSNLASEKMLFAGNYWLRAGFRNNRLVVDLADNSCCCGYSRGSYTISGFIANNTWTHVALTGLRDANGATITGFVNGAQSGIQIFTTPGFSFVNDNTGCGVDRTLTFSRDNQWSPTFDGNIDEALFYNRDLTLTEINYLFATQNADFIPDPELTIGNFNNFTGNMSWNSTFSGVVKIGVLPIACSGPGDLVIRNVTVVSQPTITTAVGANPLSCAVGASGSVTITLTGFVGALGTQFEADLNNDLIYENRGTITGLTPIVLNINNGLPSGSVINNISVRQANTLCNANPSPYAFNFSVSGFVNPSAAIPTSLQGTNPVCSGATSSGINVIGAENGISYFAMIGNNVVSSTVLGTGGTITLSITGNNILTSSGLNTVYQVKTIAVSPGCSVVTLTGIQNITVSGPSAAGTAAVTGANPICTGQNSSLTLSGFNGTINWIVSTNSGASFVAAGSSSANYITPSLTQTSMYRAIVTNGVCPAATTVSAPTITVNPNVTTPVFTIAGALATRCQGAATITYGASITSGILVYDLASAGASTINASTGAVTWDAAFSGIATITASVAGCGGPLTSTFVVTVSGTSNPGTISGSGAVCTGSSVTLNLTGAVGTIQWQSSTNGGAVWNNETGTISSLGPIIVTTTTSYRTIASNGVCPAVTTSGANIYVLTVNPNVTTPVFTSGTTSLCQGAAPTSYTATISSGVLSYGVTGAGNTVNASTGLVTWAPAYFGIATVSATVTGCGGPLVADRLVTVSGTPVVGVISGTTPVCSGNSQTLTATGASGSLQWAFSTNGGASYTNLGTGSTQITGALTTTTTYRVIASSGICPITSTSSTIVVDQPSNAGTVANAQTVCDGSSVTVSLTGITGTIQNWLRSNDAGATYSTVANVASTLTQVVSGSATVRYGVAVQNGTCSVATSTSPVIITINPQSEGGTITGNNTTIVPGGNTGTMNLTGQVGTVVGWQRSTDNVVFNYLAATAGASTFNENLASQGTYYYRAIIQSGVCGTITSNVVVVNVVGNGGSVTIAGVTQRCIGSATGTMTLTGFAGITINSWYYSINGGAYIAVPGSAGQTFVGFSNLNVAGNWNFIAVIDGTNTSTGQSFTVDPQTNAGTLAVTGANPICTGGSSSLTLSGFTGTVQDWEQRPVGGSFTSIPFSGTNYPASGLTTTTGFRAIVQSGVCPASVTGIVSISVDGVSLAGSISGNTAICSSSSGLNLTLTGSFGSRLWRSTSNGGASYTNLGSGLTQATGALTTTTSYDVIVTNGVCPAVTTTGAIVNVDQVPVGGTVSGGGYEIPLGSTTGTFALSGQSGNITTWQVSINNGAFADIAGTAGQNPLASQSPASPGTYVYRAVLGNGVCGTVLSSNSSVVSVVGVGGTVTPGDATVCIGSSSGAMTLTGYAGSVVRWQVSTTSGISWINIPVTIDIYSGMTLSQAGTYQFRAEVSGSQFSGIRTVTVSPLPIVGTLSPLTSTICYNTAQTIAVSGNNGSVSRWLYSDDAGSTWVDFANAGTTSISSGNIVADRRFAVEITTPGCAVASTSGSNTSNITVRTEASAGTPVATGTGSPDFCIGSSVLVSATGVNTTVVAWESSPDGTLWNPTTFTGTSFSSSYNSIVDIFYRPVLQNGVGCLTVAGSANVRVRTQSCTAFASVTGIPTSNICVSSATVSTFTDASQPLNVVPVIAWNWNFGAGASPATSSLQNPGSVTYSTAGSKTVTLVITVTGGSTATYTGAAFTVDQAPNIGSLAINNTTVCSGGLITTINLSVTGTTWDAIRYFEDGVSIGTSAQILGFTPSSVGNRAYKAEATNGTCLTAATTTGSVVVVSQPVVTAFNYNSGNAFCSDFVGNALPSTTLIAGGIFSSTGSLTFVNNTTGSINIAANSASGTNTVTYTVSAQNGCDVASNFTSVAITPKANIAFDYLTKNYCNNFTTPVQLSLSPATGGGTYSSNPSGLVNSNGTITPDGKTPGLYNVFYSVPNGVCGTEVATVSGFNITAAPTIPSFNFPDGVYCTNENIQANILGVLPSGAFESTSSNANSITINNSGQLTGIAAGSFSVRYVIPASSTCEAVSLNSTNNPLVINSAPTNPSVEFPSPICAGDSKQASNATLSGVTMVSNVNLVFDNVVPPIITPLASLSTGSYSYEYYQSVPGCTIVPKTGTVNVTSRPIAPNFTYNNILQPNSSFCNEDATTPTGTFSGGSFTWSDRNVSFSGVRTLSIDNLTGEVNLAATTPSIYDVTYALNVDNFAGCNVPASTTFVLSVTSSLGGKVVSNLPSSGVCEGSKVALNLQGNRGNSIKWQELIGTNWVPVPTDTNSINLITSTLSGTVHYFRAAVQNGFCKVAFSEPDTVNVTPTPVGGIAYALDQDTKVLTTPGTIVCINSQTTLTLTGYVGTITWQVADEDNPNSNWLTVNSPLANSDSIYTSEQFVRQQRKFYRASLVNGPCTNPAYSTIVWVELCDENPFIPNALTPYSSDQNSYWDIKKLRLKPNAEVRIYNRYGVEVKYLTGNDVNKGAGWDGDNLPAGTYYFVIDTKDGVKEKTGALTIVK